MLVLLTIAIQNGAYLSALTWLSWRFERTQGFDAFHLVAAFASGVLVAESAFSRGADAAVAISLGAIAAWAVDAYLGKLIDRRLGGGGMVVMIATASLALLIFDWFTAYVPVSMAGAQEQLVPLLTGIWVCGASLVAASGWTRRGRNLRLGRLNRWATVYWGGISGLPTIMIAVTTWGAWHCVLGFPLATTGLLSATLLKDVGMAILIARVAGARGSRLILAICVTASSLKVVAGYTVTTPLAMPMVDAMVFVALFLWLRYRTGRTAWSTDAVR